MNRVYVLAAAEEQRERQILRLVGGVPECHHGVVAVPCAPIADLVGRAFRDSVGHHFKDIGVLLVYTPTGKNESPFVFAFRMRLTDPLKVLSPAASSKSGTFRFAVWCGNTVVFGIVAECGEPLAIHHS